MLNNNPSSIKTWLNNDYLGCSQECMNSHYFADRLTKKPNTFTTKSLDKLCNILNAKHNGFDVVIFFQNIHMDID